jgi:hypothetical protein
MLSESERRPKARSIINQMLLPKRGWLDQSHERRRAAESTARALLEIGAIDDDGKQVFQAEHAITDEITSWCRDKQDFAQLPDRIVASLANQYLLPR